MDGRVRGARDGSPRHSPRCCAGASTRTRSTPARPRSASAPRRAAWMPQPAAGASRPSKSGSHPQATCVRLSLFWSATHSAPTQGIHARDTRLRSSTATKQRCHRHTTRTSPAATLSPLWAAHERYRSTLGLTALSHKTLTHTRNVRRCTYEIGIPPRKGHPGLHTRVSSLWTRCARSCYTALHATRQHLLAVGARRRRHWTHGCHVARASRSGQRRCIIKRPSP